MTTRKLFEKEIVKKSNIKNKYGYVLNNSDNLIDGAQIDWFYDDLMQGSGSELKCKFNALYSSSALAVNNFAFVKEHLKDFSFLTYSDFDDARFERQFPTGLSVTPPNLDFTLESKETIIGFESKYLEPLDKKKVKFAASYNKSNLHYLDDFWFNLIKKYIDKGKELFLDVAQLIKHSIGLINFNNEQKASNKQTKKLILVYIFWKPININHYGHTEYDQHYKELKEFNTEMEKQSEIEFISMTYSDFWDSYKNNATFNKHFNKVRDRYSIEI